MKFQLDPTVRSASGKTKNSQLVHFYLRGQQVARARADTKFPRTSEQVLVLEQRNAAMKAWVMLSPEVREAWSLWAKTFSQVCPRRGVMKYLSGREVYTSSSTYRVRLGLPPSTEAPVPLSRPVILTLNELGHEDQHTFRFRVGVPQTPLIMWDQMPDLAVLFRITPPTKSPARAPYRTEYRYVRGANALSSGLLLPTSETVFEFSGSAFGVLPGQRFGIEATPVRLADGVCGTPLVADTVRLPG